VRSCGVPACIDVVVVEALPINESDQAVLTERKVVEGLIPTLPGRKIGRPTRARVVGRKIGRLRIQRTSQSLSSREKQARRHHHHRHHFAHGFLPLILCYGHETRSQTWSARESTYYAIGEAQVFRAFPSPPRVVIASKIR